MRHVLSILISLSLAGAIHSGPAAGENKDCHHGETASAAPTAPSEAAEPTTGGDGEARDKADLALPAPEIPDVEVLDQDGRSRRFYSDLVKDKVVVIQFVFTTCTTICKPLSAVFAQLQKALGPDSDVRLISISVDPVTDVPARLKAHAERFHAGPGWTFVTGDKARIDRLLRALGAFTADKLTHTAFVLAGNAKTGKWIRTYGLASSETLLEKIKAVSGAMDREWFTDLPLLDQHGNRLRFYTDVLEGKLVVMDFIFTRCTSVCPLLTATMKGVQQNLADLPAGQAELVSVSVDPEYDTPRVLAAFAERYKAGPGWTFLTGKKEHVDWILYKLGAWTPEKETHYSVFLVGDALTGRWTKLVGTTPSSEIAAAARELLARR